MGNVKKAIEEVQEETEHEKEIKELRGALIRSERKAVKAKAKTDELVAAVYQAASDAALMQSRPSITPPKKDQRKTKTPEAALVHLTDLQYGKKTVSYSMAVAERRVMQYADKIEQITEIQRADHAVNECHIMLGGDMVEGRGNIFPGQIHEIEAGLYDQAFGCASLIEAFIRRLMGVFSSVSVWEETGNHGRLGKKGEDGPRDNADGLTYEIARRTMGEQKSLTWTKQTTWHQMVPIGNYTAMLAHGDEIKGFGGNVPAFGILRKCNAWATGVVEKFNDVYLGHFHQEMTLTLANGGSIFVTPSTESGSVYAQEFCAATGMPGQRLHYVNPKAGRVTSQYILHLD